MRRLIASFLPALALGLTGCGTADDASVGVAVIGPDDPLTGEGLRLSLAGQLGRAATREGLVALDHQGEVVPAMAERWTVPDDGLSYIFRIRNSDWPDGTPITAPAVRDRLRQTLASLRGTSLGLDLAPIDEVRAMTGRVVEIRLSAPMPGLLQLLAQPELGLERGGSGAGPMQVERVEDGIALDAVPPSARGFPQPEEWQDQFRVLMRGGPVEQAVAAFEDGSVNLVLGGTIVDLPLADTGALSRGTIRLDAALGLLGFEVANAEGFLATAANREAVAMAIDRSQLMQPFNVGGWVATTRIVAPGLPDDSGGVPERWAGLDIEERQSLAGQRVSAWERANDAEAAVAVFLPRGPGSDRLFAQIRRGLAAAGIAARRAESEGAADLVLKDRLARFAGARWFLNQFNCGITEGLCSEGADALVRQSLAVATPAEQASLLAEAERLMLAENLFIPLGAPIRWSLVRGGVQGFQENRWSVHPLFALSQRPM